MNPLHRFTLPALSLACLTSILAGPLWLPGTIAPQGHAQPASPSASDYQARSIDSALPATTNHLESSPSLSSPLLLDTQPVTLPDTLYSPLLKTDSLTLGLGDILTGVQANNLFIQMEDTRRDVARAKLVSTLIDPLPSINAQYSLSWFEGVIQLFGNQTIGIRQTVHEPTIRYSQTLQLGGKQLWDTLGARRNVQAASAQLNATIQQQLAAACREFYDWHEAYYQNEVAQAGVKAASELVRRNEARYSAGIGTKLEVMQAQAQHSERIQQQFLAIKQLATTEEILLNRLNLPISVRLKPTKLVNQRHAGLTTHGHTDWLNATINAHPDMERLEREVAALRWQSRSVLSTVMPELNVSAYTGARGPKLNQTSRITGAGFTLRTTVGDKLGLLMPATYVGARKLTENKKTERDATHRQLESLTLQALLEVQRADKTLDAAQAQESAAQEAYRLATARLGVGVGTQLDVLDASDRWQQAQGASVTALMDYNRAQIQLLEALGKAEPAYLLYGGKVNAAGQLVANPPSAFAIPASATSSETEDETDLSPTTLQPPSPFQPLQSTGASSNEN